jgi:RNA polymerase sigma-70 factor, ECF subfamily
MLATDIRAPSKPQSDLSHQAPDIFAQHGAFVRRTLRYLGVGESDLDDLMQEVFLVVHRRLDHFEEKGRTRAWLYSICLRVTFSQRRKRACWHKKTRISALRAESTEPSQHEHVEHNEALMRGVQLLNQLAPHQRQIFVLYEVHDLSMSEIAETLGCKLQTAYSRLHRARSQISAAAERIAAEGGV